MADSFQAALASFQRNNSSQFHSKTQNRRPDAWNEGENVPSNTCAQFNGNAFSLRLVNHQIISDLPHENIWKAWIEKGIEEGVKVHVFVHAKNPEQVSSEWVKSFLLPYSRQPRWGSIEITRAMVDLFETALSKMEVSRMVLLSESCIPIAPMKEVLFQLWREEKSWINFRTAPDNGYDRDQKWGRVSASVPKGCICKADQWICLTRSHAEDIVSLPHTTRLDICELFKDTVASDELYVPTLLRILGEIPKEGESDTVNRRCVTWADWTTSPKHPATFESLAACRGWPADAIEKGCLFARKFPSGSVSQEAWDGLIEKRVTVFEKILADMPEDARKLAEETIAGTSSPQSSSCLPPNARVVMDEQVNRRKRSHDDEDKNAWQQRTGDRRRSSWNESTSHMRGRGWDWEDRGRSRREWSWGKRGRSYERGYDVASGYTHHHHIDYSHNYHRISDRRGGSKENRRSTRSGEFGNGGRYEYHHGRSHNADDYYRDDIIEGDSYHNDHHDSTRKDGGRGYYNYSKRHKTYHEKSESVIGDTKRRRYIDDDDDQIAKQHEHCPPGALVWDANNDPPGTTPKPLDEYDNGGVSSETGQRRSKEMNLPPTTNVDGGSLATTSSSVRDTSTPTIGNQPFNGSGTAANECHEEDLEIVRVEPHKANQKPFACDGW